MILTGLRHIARRLTHGFAVVAAAAAAMMMVMTSCRGDAPDMPAGDDQSGFVTFRVQARKASSLASRATWGDGYESEGGNDFETRLIREQLNVVISDADCSQEYPVTNLICTRRTETVDMVTYDYIGRLNSEDIDKIKQLSDGRLHVVANAGGNVRPSGAPFFTYFGQPDDKFRAIPMWGVTAYDFSTIKAGTSVNVGEVALLRAMAKVAIIKDSNEGNCIRKLLSVQMSAANKLGWVLPNEWKTVKKTTELDRHSIRPFLPPVTDVNAFTGTDDAIEFYLPEVANPDADELKLSLTFDTKKGELTRDLYFRPYVDGKPGDTRLDVLRNYLYSYTVNLRSTSGDLTIIADLRSYESVELNPGFGNPMNKEDLNK